MVAPHHRKNSSGIWKNSFFNLFYIGPVHPYRYVVFTFAGSGTRMTTDTLSVVNNKSIFHTRNGFVLMRIPIFNLVIKKQYRIFIKVSRLLSLKFNEMPVSGCNISYLKVVIDSKLFIDLGLIFSSERYWLFLSKHIYEH